MTPREKKRNKGVRLGKILLLGKEKEQGSKAGKDSFVMRCFECNGSGQPKIFQITFSDSESSDFEEGSDGEGNFIAFAASVEMDGERLLIEFENVEVDGLVASKREKLIMLNAFIG